MEREGESCVFSVHLLGSAEVEFSRERIKIRQGLSGLGKFGLFAVIAHAPGFWDTRLGFFTYLCTPPVTGTILVFCCLLWLFFGHFSPLLPLFMGPVFVLCQSAGLLFCICLAFFRRLLWGMGPSLLASGAALLQLAALSVWMVLIWLYSRIWHLHSKV